MKGTKSVIPGDRKERCFLCGRYGSMHAHHIFEGSCRSQSEIHGLKVHLCPACHQFVHSKDGNQVRLDLHQMGQTEYMDQKIAEGMAEEEALQDFREHFIRSYL